MWSSAWPMPGQPSPTMPLCLSLWLLPANWQGNSPPSPLPSLDDLLWLPLHPRGQRCLSIQVPGMSWSLARAPSSSEDEGFRGSGHCPPALAHLFLEPFPNPGADARSGEGQLGSLVRRRQYSWRERTDPTVGEVLSGAGRNLAPAGFPQPGEEGGPQTGARAPVCPCCSVAL